MKHLIFYVPWCFNTSKGYQRQKFLPFKPACRLRGNFLVSSVNKYNENHIFFKVRWESFYESLDISNPIVSIKWQKSFTRVWLFTDISDWIRWSEFCRLKRDFYLRQTLTFLRKLIVLKDALHLIEIWKTFSA